MAVATQVRLANDIAVQFSYLPHDAAVAAIAGHLRTFWAPPMRAQLLACVDAAAVGLDPLAVEAAEELR